MNPVKSSHILPEFHDFAFFGELARSVLRDTESQHKMTILEVYQIIQQKDKNLQKNKC